MITHDLTLQRNTFLTSIAFTRAGLFIIVISALGLIMNRSRTISVLAQGPPVPSYAQKSNKGRRLHSLPSIRIQSKRLPPDFFTYRESNQNQGQRLGKNRIKSLQNQSEDIRSTPYFRETLSKDVRQTRQSKSEQRPNYDDNKPRGKTLPLRKKELELTFSKQVLKREEKVTPMIISIGKRKRKVQENQFQDIGTAFLSPMKNEIEGIMKRKHLNVSKYPYLMTQRAKVMHQNKMLPILKGKYPNVF